MRGDAPGVTLTRTARGDRLDLGHERPGSTRVAWSRTTASFSRAMSSIVGPSQRVCSRPTVVSTWTFEGITFVAS